MIMEILYQCFMLIKFSYFSKVFFHGNLDSFCQFFEENILSKTFSEIFPHLFIEAIFFNCLITTCYKLKD